MFKSKNRFWPNGATKLRNASLLMSALETANFKHSFDSQTHTVVRKRSNELVDLFYNKFAS